MYRLVSQFLLVSGGTVARTARDLRLPQVPEAPVNTHRPREATAVGPAETTIAPACQNFTTGAHTILARGASQLKPQGAMPIPTQAPGRFLSLLKKPNLHNGALQYVTYFNNVIVAVAEDINGEKS